MSREWRKIRDAILSTHPECAARGCHAPATALHHLSNRSVGWKDDSIENLMPLCHDHHVGLHGIHSIGKVTWKERYG